MDHLRLRNLPFLAKLGLTAVIATFGMGLAASLAHIRNHYENRDERPGLTRDDIVSAYAGLNAPAPLQAIVENGHPGGVQVELKPAAKDALLKWLKADRIAENYDNIDFSDPTPRDVFTASCISCHSGKGEDAKARAIPLESWEQVKKYAFARKVERVPDKIKVISTHTHALSLATMSVAVGALALATGWPRLITGGLLAIMGLGLLADISAWWLTNFSARWVDMIIVGGAAYNGATALLLILIFLETWRWREAKR